MIKIHQADGSGEGYGDLDGWGCGQGCGESEGRGIDYGVCSHGEGCGDGMVS